MANEAPDASSSGAAADLAADEARLTAIAVELANAIEDAVPGWIERIGIDRVAAAGMPVGDDVRDRLRVAATTTAARLAPRVREVLLADVDAGAGSPLAVLRAELEPATEALRALGVPPPDRDDFVVDRFPGDVYALGPAAFADVDESLVELGVTWGAARAHVHLRRREVDR